MLCKLATVCGLVAMFVVVARGYSSGAPTEVCGDMIPQHPGSPLKTPAPYYVRVDKKNINSEGEVQITIAGKQGKKFKGFFVQGRVGDEPVGSFEQAEDVNTVDCGAGLRTAATHANSNDKQKIVLKWKAPKGLTETVRFNTTIVQNGKVYWVGVTSPQVQVGKATARRQ